MGQNGKWQNVYYDGIEVFSTGFSTLHVEFEFDIYEIFVNPFQFDKISLLGYVQTSILLLNT